MSRSSLVRATLGALVCGLIVWQPVLALADSSWPIASTTNAAPAVQTSDDNAFLTTDAQQIAQSAGSGMPHRLPLWKKGLDYTLDFSMAWPFGTTGIAHGESLPGNMDGILRYAFNPNTRIVAGYYGLQEYPVGFSTGTVPLYLQGVATPIGTAPLASNNAVVNNYIFIAHLDQVIWTKLMGQDFPIILSPTYTQRWGTIAGGTDYLPVEEQGLPYLEHYRTGKFYAFGVTIPVPILTQPKFGLLTTYTVGPQWTAGREGANATDTAQTVQILHMIWHPNWMPQLQFDLQPSLYPNYLPTDIWPQHYLTMIYSVAYSFGRDFTDKEGRPIGRLFNPFIQATVSMGGAMNISPYGIKAVYCQALPCLSPSSLYPSLGANHAAQFQLKIGVGHPDVIPL